jgi:hypothetical protein
MPGGPRTTAGKAVAKLNSLTHGLRAAVPVLPIEDAGEWEAHRAGILASLAPIGALEEALAARVALLLWRLGRVARFETAVATAAQEDSEGDYARREEEKERYAGSWASHSPDELRADLRRYAALLRLMRRLAAMDDGRAIAGEAAGDILRQCGTVAGDNDGEFDPDAVDYPLAADFAWGDFPDITAATLRACIAAIADASKVAVTDLIAGAVYHYECETRSAQYRLEQAEKTIGRWREARAVLEGPELEKVMRYEGHLHRQLLQTLHELEAMQARRAGKPAPLARLDVQGLEPTG